LATHASVTFGIFICEECAEMHHQVLGPRISNIKSLTKPSAIADANWDEYLLKFMEYGGNYQYREFMHYYNIRCKEIYKKYFHKASQYY
jgi:hypothetical protein